MKNKELFDYTKNTVTARLKAINSTNYDAKYIFYDAFRFALQMTIEPNFERIKRNIYIYNNKNEYPNILICGNIKIQNYCIEEIDFAEQYFKNLNELKNEKLAFDKTIKNLENVN